MSATPTTEPLPLIPASQIGVDVEASDGVARAGLNEL